MLVFLTDGAIGNEQQLFDTITAGLGRSRVFMVGIGSAPNSHLMSRAAELGRVRELTLVQPRARFDGDAAHLEIPQRLVDLGQDVRSRLGRSRLGR